MVMQDSRREKSWRSLVRQVKRQTVDTANIRAEHPAIAVIVLLIQLNQNISSL
jgi:hypothetical protein